MTPLENRLASVLENLRQASIRLRQYGTASARRDLIQAEDYAEVALEEYTAVRSREEG